MKVQELIQKLLKQDPDAEVFKYIAEVDGVDEIWNVNLDHDEYYVLTKKRGNPAAVIL